MAEILKDSRGYEIGRIVSQGNQDILLDARGYRIGHYDRSNNTTYDARGHRLCSGDQLLRLL